MKTPLAVGLALAALTVPALLQAQPAGVGGRPDTTLGIEGGIALGSDLSDPFGREMDDVEISYFGISASQAFSVAPNTSASLGFEYVRYDIDFDQGLALLPEEVEGVSLDLSLRHRVDERWSLIGGLEVGLYGADGEFGSDAFGLDVSLLGLRKMSDTFTLAFGVIYRSMADEPVLPALGFDWRPDDTWAVSVGFPRSAVTYKLSEATDVALQFSARGGTYHVEKPIAPALSSLGMNLAGTELDYTELRVGLALTHRPTANLELHASAGVIVYREFDYYERGYEIDGDGGTPFFGGGVTYSF